MISTTPYLIRAIFEWCSDQGFTPHLLVDASIEGVEVPRQLVENDRIVLNIQSSAVRSLDLGNEWVMFNARFSGKPMNISVPIGAVRAIFARENGLGCAFDSVTEPAAGELDPASNKQVEQDQKNPAQKTKSKNDKKPHLKLV